MPRAGYDEVVLLTGFPSFAARKMCEELVRGPQRTLVHAIVRAKPQVRSDAELALDALPLEQRRRVNLIEGDAASMDLGLSGAELKALTPEIDIIHHMAQVSYLGADKELATHVNVNGAREILEVASLCKSLRCLVHHSTAQVSGNRTGLVLEDELDKGQTFKNDIEETLARAERIIRSKIRMSEMMSTGGSSSSNRRDRDRDRRNPAATLRAATGKLPIAIVRPTIIVGDSQTGEVDRFDGPYFLILLIVTSPPDFPLPLPAGRGAALLHLVPIDYVVRAARAIGRHPRAPGRTFHIGDPAPLTVRRVFDLVASAGGRRSPRGFLPANLTKALLRTPGLDRLAKSPRAFLDSLATPVSYSFANTAEVLSDTEAAGGLRCPPFESYVEGLVEYVQHRLREKRAKAEEQEEEAEVEDPLV